MWYLGESSFLPSFPNFPACPVPTFSHQLATSSRTTRTKFAKVSDMIISPPVVLKPKEVQASVMMLLRANSISKPVCIVICSPALTAKSKLENNINMSRCPSTFLKQQLPFFQQMFSKLKSQDIVKSCTGTNYKTIRADLLDPNVQCFSCVWYTTVEICSTYTFEFCPVNDGEGTVPDHQLGGRDDVDHLSFFNLELLYLISVSICSVLSILFRIVLLLSHWLR